MMNQNFSKGFKFGMVVPVLGVMLLQSVSAWAATPEDRAAAKSARVEARGDARQADFCAKLDSRSAVLSGRVGERVTKIDTHQGERLSKIGSKRSTHDTTRTTKRSERDTKLGALYAKLEAAADTDEKRAAVAKFKSTVESAIDTRRAAADTAITSFRSDMDALVSGRQGSVDTVATTYQAAVAAALAQAKTDCAGGKAPSEVRGTLKTSLAAAREALKGSRGNIDKIKDDVQALATKRKVAREAASSAYQATVDTARAELKAVMGN
jgi:hypothetical protein